MVKPAPEYANRYKMTVFGGSVIIEFYYNRKFLTSIAVDKTLVDAMVISLHSFNSNNPPTPQQPSSSDSRI